MQGELNREAANMQGEKNREAARQAVAFQRAKRLEVEKNRLTFEDMQLVVSPCNWHTAVNVLYGFYQTLPDNPTRLSNFCLWVIRPHRWYVWLLKLISLIILEPHAHIV